MQIAAMLIGLALLALLALGVSLFIPVSDGRSGLDHAWPWMTGMIAILLAAAAAVASHARRSPDAWPYRSVWPRIVVALVVALVALAFTTGVIV